MKTLLSLGLCVALFLPVAQAQTNPAAPAVASRLTVAQVEELVAPIALYPDPLIALILPAATQPSEIVLAARFLERGSPADAATNEPWDDAVKALVRYPEVLEYLDENLEWTRSLGETFLDQRDLVMASIQTLRARARENGLLSSSPEQEVIVEADEIRIVPAQPTVIYVPRYDPEVLYVSHLYTYWPRPFITFGIGYSVGWWLTFDCDWRFRTVHIVHRPEYWYHRPDWRVRYHPHHRHPDWRWTRWMPRPHHHRHHVSSHRASERVLRPKRDWEAARRTRLAAQQQTIARTSQPVSSSPQRLDNASPQLSRRDSNRDRNRHRDNYGNRERERGRHPGVVRSSGASVVATAPKVPTAPTVVTTPTHRPDAHPHNDSRNNEWRGRALFPK